MTMTGRKVIKAKVGLLELARQLGSVTQACRVMGYSRDSFYRFSDLETMSWTRSPWTPICPRRGRSDDVRHEEDRSFFIC